MASMTLPSRPPRPRTGSVHHKRLFVKRALMVLMPMGILAGFAGMAKFYSIDRALLQQTASLARIVSKQQGLWLVRSSPPNSDLCDRGQGRTRLRPPDANPCLPDHCRLDDYTPWEEWKACKSRQLAAGGWAADEARVASAVAQLHNESIAAAASIGAEAPEPPSALNVSSATAAAFDAFIIQHKDHLPWEGSNFTAVLPEFRLFEGPLIFSINNIINNLPVNWRIQIVGGPTMCNGMRRLFPMEVAAGKIVLTDVGDRKPDHDQISQFLTDLDDFYSRLLGHTWLIFNYDSVICSKQRHLLKHFITTKRGYWGAPWSHWTREPKVGGNGGFSLRTKDFIYTVLQRFPWTWGAGPEDWYICNKAADMYDELPDDIKPASFDEELAFSSEMMYSEAPFGTHQFWCCLDGASPKLWTMFDNCPEMWGILNVGIFDYRPVWKDMVCQANVTRTDFVPGVNITFDFAQLCPENVLE